MKIAVCCKITPDSEDVQVSEHGDVDLSRAQWGVSEYDYQAIQAAMDVADDGDEIICITAGDARVAESKNVKALLSRGPARLVAVVGESAIGADAAKTSTVLAAAIKHVEADIVLFGEGSSDGYARQAGVQTGALLGWPAANYVCGIEREEGAVVVQRDLEDGIQSCRMTLPCAISVTSNINTPPLPSMRAILAAGKKPVEKLDAAELVGTTPEAALNAVENSAPETPVRKCILVEGSPEEMATQLVSYLKQENVLV